ncbi:PREDICTED: serpin A9 [Elephantulus edwardii]|uniref:serpin A9 n=1 Tax=Elephantulus edwardii TaxID=28737 RepID=UPI0003F0ADB4|nr:PREDICTED: serpin A9 [Elephantulus edwardii]
MSEGKGGTSTFHVSSVNTDFAFHLYRRLAVKDSLQNIFFSPKKINSYVEKETKGKIVDLVRGLDGMTLMVMVNYVFFKAKWEKPFDPAETSQASPFTVSKSTTVKVPMMHQVQQLDFGVDLELNCSVLRMNYSRGAQAFFILPGQGKMGQLEQALSAARLRKWDRLLQKRLVEVFLPKFSISASYDLGTILPKMGIKDAFDSKADFSGITKKHSLMISKAAHKSMLDVGEEGTEAAAASDVKLTVRSKEKPIHHACTISFARPFLVLMKIFDNLLLAGKVVDPTKP